MTPQAMPSVDPSVLVVSLGWAAASALLLVLSIRVEARLVAWFWALSFVVSSVLAVVFFWRTVRGGGA